MYIFAHIIAITLVYMYSSGQVQYSLLVHEKLEVMEGSIIYYSTGADNGREGWTTAVKPKSHFGNLMSQSA